MTYQSTVLADTPYAYWPLDETSGTTANDASGNGRNATYTGGFTLNSETTGRGRAAAFDGTSGYVNKAATSDNWQFTTWTLECWAKFPSIPSVDQPICLITPSFPGTGPLNMAMGLNTNGPGLGNVGKFSGGLFTAGNWATAVYGTAITAGVWHHYVCRFTTPTIGVDLFLDGVKVSGFTTIKTTDVPTSPPSIYLAHRWDTASSPFFTAVTMQHAAIYNYAVSDSRIAAHFSGGERLRDARLSAQVLVSAPSKVRDARISAQVLVGPPQRVRDARLSVQVLTRDAIPLSDGGIWGIPISVPIAPPSGPRTILGPRRMGDIAISKLAGGASGPFTATLPNSPPTAGNLLLAAVANMGNNTTATVSTPTGWTPGPSMVGTTGSQRTSLWLFYRWADGTETNPTFTIGPNTLGGGALIEEWAGLDPAAVPSRSGGLLQQFLSGTPFTMTDTILTPRDNDWVWTAFMSQQVNDVAQGNVPPWAAPQVPFSGSTTAAQLPAGQATLAYGVYANAGTQHPAVGPITPPANSTNALASFGFKTAAGTRPGVAESVRGTGATTSMSVTLNTVPDPSDQLILVLFRQASTALGTTTVAGCGATWTPLDIHDTGGFTGNVWVGTGATSAGPVTITCATAPSSGHLRLLRVAGTGPAVSAAYGTVTSAASATSPTVTAGPGQVVLAAQCSSPNPNNEQFLASATPAPRNWSKDIYAAAGQTSQCGWIAPSAPGTSCNVTGTSGSAKAWVTCMIVCG